MPLKQIPLPLPNEKQVSYGDRLLWHQLAVQLNNQSDSMLTESEYVEAVCRYFPDAVVENVKRYRSYFNGIHKSMGFRDAGSLPTHVEFAPE